MTRALYRCLLWLHPSGFRRQFSGEMMCTFEEASAVESSAGLLLDGVFSLMRQWILRSGLWKVAVALIGGLMEISAGGIGQLMFGRTQLDSRLAEGRISGDPALTGLMLLTVCSVTGVLVMVLLLVLWVKKLNTRRIHDLALSRR